MASKTGEKGLLLEELLRAYFLRSGIYAVRSVPLQQQGDDLTDVDVWLYERPTGSSRRRQIVDAKSKLKPKAVERLLWTKGLCELLGVDGAYVATTDNRPMLKQIAFRLGVSILDGDDLNRIKESEKVLYPERLSEEDVDEIIKSVDKARKNKELQLGYHDLKASLIDDFGAGTVNRALEHFNFFSKVLTSSHPRSSASEAALRLSYFSASIVAIAVDFSLAKISFKSAEERHRTLINIVRYGDDDESRGSEKIRIAAALVERYVPSGRAVSQSMINAIRNDYERIPAEIIADHILTHLKNDGLFRIARSLESETFGKVLRSFDELSVEEKSFLGVLMDFSEVDRSAFANAWSSKMATTEANDVDRTDVSLGPLFENSSLEK